MKIILMCFFISTQCFAAPMTLAEAKEKVIQIRNKPNRTQKDAQDMREAIKVLAGGIFNRE